MDQFDNWDVAESFFPAVGAPSAETFAAACTGTSHNLP